MLRFTLPAMVSIALLAIGVSCKPPRPDKQSLEHVGAADTPDVDVSPSALPVPEAEVEAPPDEPTVYGQFLEAGFVAAFAGETGVTLYDETGAATQVIDEPFEWLTVDYGAGLLWLERPWSQTHTPGLYVVDIMSTEIRLTRVTRLELGLEIVGLDGRPLQMTEGIVPYQIRLDVNPAAILMTAGELQCGSECNPSAEFIALMDGVRSRYRSGGPAVAHSTRRLTPPAVHLQDMRAGYSVPLGSLPLSLRLMKGLGQHHDNIAWQLHDDATNEYVSAITSERSERALKEGSQVQHLMICEGENTLVVGRRLFTRDLIRLDQEGRGSSFGVCLHGGVLFEDRTGFRFVDPYIGRPRPSER